MWSRSEIRLWRRKKQRKNSSKAAYQLAEFQTRHARRSKSNAENLVRAVRRAITRLHAHLAGAKAKDGTPHPVLRAFAAHLAKYLLTPSARYSGKVAAKARSGLAGRFTYEPPARRSLDQLSSNRAPP